MSLKDYSKRGKKIVAASVATAMCLSTVIISNYNNEPVEAAKLVVGDLNGNGNLDLEDATGALKLALAIEESTPEKLVLCDINGDGNIGLDDATELLKGALNIRTFEDIDSTSTPDATQTPNTLTPPPKSPGVVPPVTLPPIPTSIPLPKVEPGIPVTGTAISSVSQEQLHGAEYDENTGIYTFTDANAASKRGIQFNNPWAGKTELRQTVDEAIPSFMVNDKGEAVGLIDNDKLLSLDGKKTVLGTIEKKEDDNIEVTPVTSASAEVSGDAVISGKSVKWTEGLMPTVKGINSKTEYLSDYAELYVKPKWTNGTSISFWCKYKWADSRMSDAAPMLVIKNSHGCDNQVGGFAKEGHTGDFAVMMRLNGGVSLEGDESGNCFKADNSIAGKDGEWNYYTVTFANDWITVYVNGQELVYYDLEIDKDNIQFFNNGFLTRYSPVYEIKKSDVNDVRNYLKNGWTSKTGEKLDVLDKECCLIGNGRYSNPDAVTIKKNSNLTYDLLIDMLTKDTTEIWFGSSSETKCVCLTSVNTGSSAYKVQTGTQLADVNCYDSELTAEEVSANYEKEYAANAAKFGLTEE